VRWNLPVIVATFGQPEDITSPGCGGKVFSFPVTLLDRDHTGTSLQSSNTNFLRIKTLVSGSLTWGLRNTDLIKVLFEIVKERLADALKSSYLSKIDDFEIPINTATHKGPCPYDPMLIQDPTGAVVEIEIKHRIGFI
jgi:hypothetical protein